MNGKSHVTKGRREAFEDISQKTGAYVNPPSYTDRVGGQRNLRNILIY